MFLSLAKLFEAAGGTREQVLLVHPAMVTKAGSHPAQG